jgi:PDZ domain-containing protein
VRRKVVVISLAVVLALLVTAVVVVIRGAHGYYSIAPGSAPIVSADSTCRPAHGDSYTLPGGHPCVRLVLPAGKTHAVTGSISMVDVLVGPATPGDYLLSKLGLLHRFRDGTVLVPSKAILGTTPPAQLDCQSTQQMTNASSAATVVALRRLGYTVQENDLGAQVDQVQPGTPAAVSGLKCNDLITAINGEAIHGSTDLVNAIHALAPGDTARLTVSRPTTQGSAPKTLDLTARLTDTPAQPGSAADPNRAFLGVASETRNTFLYPFDVNVQVGQIGGPSAGLALTLGLIDSLTAGQLTGGHRVAATGTMDLQGDVGDVGGVAQKAVSVRRAGAEMFFVPVQEAAAARSEAGSMRVYPVSSLNQVLRILQSLGGTIPPAPAGQNGAG